MMLENARVLAVDLADAAQALVQGARPGAPDLKPDRSFVTALDRAIEAELAARIADRFPDHGILGEEGVAVNDGADWTWVLDPVDGTGAWVAGVPVHGTLIALLQGGVPVLGVMDMHRTRDRWLGVRGQVTTHNGAPCRSRAGTALAQAILSVSSPDFFGPRDLPALDAMRAATGWRVWGASCLAYGRLASGGTDIALDAGLELWDWAPFAPIIEGAGGRVTDWEGRPLRLGSGKRVLAAGDATLHDAARRVIETSPGDHAGVTDKA
ncbi:MAG: inositol monophosphatase family protein [Tabrizicola flagellatus]|uniref:inositol monophosphatase family protein n=1 Tax=Tabrizicola flagellatus TaxID=2593021 RepID=UPI00391CC43D